MSAQVYGKNKRSLLQDGDVAEHNSRVVVVLVWERASNGDIIPAEFPKPQLTLHNWIIMNIIANAIPVDYQSRHHETHLTFVVASPYL